MKQIKFSDTVNLAEPKFGSRVIYKTDQFFGAANKILNSQKPIFKEGVYDTHLEVVVDDRIFIPLEMKVNFHGLHDL